MGDPSLELKVVKGEVIQHKQRKFQELSSDQGFRTLHEGQEK
jgi:hypothetical protein